MALASPHYRMANQLVGGSLDSILSSYRDENLSYGAIVARLYADHKIEVTAPTVGKWLAALDTKAAS